MPMMFISFGKLFLKTAPENSSDAKHYQASSPTGGLLPDWRKVAL